MEDTYSTLIEDLPDNNNITPWVEKELFTQIPSMDLVEWAINQSKDFLTVFVIVFLLSSRFFRKQAGNVPYLGIYYENNSIYSLVVTALLGMFLFILARMF